jgi:GntR family transcriptional regulator, transcriptional repressor for pyruvate dehydrogenase complex
MSVPKASDILIDELRERILSGELAEGTTLPAERDLVEQTQMSRTTVREALRILEVQGLLRIVPGRAGGAVVQRPSSDAVVSSVSALIRGQRIRLTTLLETRRAIEPICAQLAAEHRTDEDLAVLEQIDEALAKPDSSFAEFLQANVDWHVAVARATRNELIAAFMVALSRAVYASTAKEAYGAPESRSLTIRAHRSITEAIRNQDAAAAVRRMSRHLDSYADGVSEDDKGESMVVPDISPAEEQT